MKMNLWVRSQYKEMLFKVNNNLIIRHNDNVENGMYFIECDSCKIAMYKTREKALKYQMKYKIYYKMLILKMQTGLFIKCQKIKERKDIMLKIRDNVDLKELEKYGFKKNSNFPDGWAMIKTYKKGRYYQEDIYVWNDRTIQVNAIELNDTIYDLIKADLVVKMEEL